MDVFSTHTQHKCKICGSGQHRGNKCEKTTQHNVANGYHQTDEDSLKLILSSNEMKPGAKGAAGGGIYFAVDSKATNWKAHKKGYLIKAKVFVGNALEIKHPGDPNMTEQKMKQEGKDSILIKRNGGDEIVIHNWERSEIIWVKKIEK